MWLFYLISAEVSGLLLTRKCKTGLKVDETDTQQLNIFFVGALSVML